MYIQKNKPELRTLNLCGVTVRARNGTPDPIGGRGNKGVVATPTRKGRCRQQHLF